MNNIRIITDHISQSDLKQIAEEYFGDFVKTVVDIKKKIMAIGGELHADEEQLLLEQGSEQKNLWGVNLYPNLAREQLIEFDSMINIRPSQNNRSRNVENTAIQKQIVDIIRMIIQ